MLLPLAGLQKPIKTNGFWTFWGPDQAKPIKNHLFFNSLSYGASRTLQKPVGFQHVELRGMNDAHSWTLLKVSSWVHPKAAEVTPGPPSGTPFWPRGAI